MPETGLRLKEIKAHLRRWIGLYIAATVALCFLNHVIYTVTRPGFSDDERLKVMLLNVESTFSDEDYAALSINLLPQLQKKDEDIRVLEFEQLPNAALGDPSSEMLLAMKLTGGYGDLYLTDEAGLDLLRAKQAVYASVYIENCRLTGEGAHLCIIANTTDMDSAQAAFEVLQKELGE